MAIASNVSLADFMLTPNLDDSRLELFDGEVTYKPGRPFLQGRALVELGTLLEQHGLAGIGPRAVFESRNSSLLLDVAFFRDDPPEDSDYIRKPPHVVVELIADDGGRDHARRRAERFVDFGVESTWIVDLEREEMVIIEGGRERLLVRGQRLVTPAVPGLDVDVSELLAHDASSHQPISSRQRPRGRC